MKLLSGPFKKVVQSPKAIFFHGFEQYIEASIWSGKYCDPRFDKPKHSVE